MLGARCGEGRKGGRCRGIVDVEIGEWSLFAYPGDGFGGGFSRDVECAMIADLMFGRRFLRPQRRSTMMWRKPELGNRYNAE